MATDIKDEAITMTRHQGNFSTAYEEDEETEEPAMAVEEYSSNTNPYFSTYQEEDPPVGRSSTPPSPATIIEMTPDEFAAEAAMTLEDSGSFSLYNENTSLSIEKTTPVVNSLESTHAEIPTTLTSDLDKGRQIDLGLKEQLIGSFSKAGSSKRENVCSLASASQPVPSDMPIQQEETQSITLSKIEESHKISISSSAKSDSSIEAQGILPEQIDRYEYITHWGKNPQFSI